MTTEPKFAKSINYFEQFILYGRKVKMIFAGMTDFFHIDTET